MDWVRSIRKYPIAFAWLVVLIGSTLIFLLATAAAPTNFFANTASFFATMMGAGASGLVTFLLVDKESKRRSDLNMLWHYKSILDTAFLLASLVNFYNCDAFKLLKFEDKYPCKQRMIKLVAVKSAERSLNHAVDISNMLNELRKSLKYINYRVNNRRKLHQMGLLTNDLKEISGLSRSTLDNVFPIITEFVTDVLNPAVRDTEDIEIRNAIFMLKENYNAFVLMNSYSKVDIELEFNQNLLNFFNDFVRLYELFMKKYPINLRINVEVEMPREETGEHTRFD